jgi:transcriptional regulator with XRE-family HTH domain
MRLAEKIKKRIKEQGLTVQEVADKLNISRIALSNQINGKPTLSTLENISNAIGCEPADFFEKEITGYVEVDGVIKKVTCLEDLEEIIKSIKDRKRQ